MIATPSRHVASRSAAPVLPLGLSQPAQARLSVTAKLLLIKEVLSVYCRVRRRLHRVELHALVNQLRDGQALADEADANHVEVIAQRLGFVVHRGLRALPTDAACLAQSLVLTSLLARRGIHGRLVIGVQSDPEFAAHAWVEHRGHPLLPAGSAFQRLVEL
jgi:hypothetical protein